MSFTPSENPITHPERESYTTLRPFRFWCQKVLPLVYDDSLSYYELLCKVVDYLNKTMEDVDHMNTDMDTLYSNFQEFQEGTFKIYNELVAYVNAYFENLDVQEEINNKLDNMVTSGELVTILMPTIASEVTAWLNDHITPTTPAIDDTLSISGAGADAKVTGENFGEVFSTERTYVAREYVLYNGKLYECIKDVTEAGAWTGNYNWVLVNIEKIENNRNNVLDEFNLLTHYPYEYRGIINPDGSYTDNPSGQFIVTDYIPVNEEILCTGYFGTVVAPYYHITGYDKNKNFTENIYRFNGGMYYNERFSLNANTKYIRVMSTVDYVNSSCVFCYNGIINDLYDFVENSNIETLKNAFDIDYKNAVLTECQNTTGFNNISNGYGCAITNKLEKNTIIEKVIFKSPISISNTHYVLFVNSNNIVTAKFNITGETTLLNYVTPSEGFLCYINDTTATINNPLTFKNNVSESAGYTRINSYIISGMGATNIGDTLQGRNYYPSSYIFVGCDVIGYNVNNEKYIEIMEDIGYSDADSLVNNSINDVTVTKCDGSLTDFIFVAKGYGIAISNTINKNTLIKNIIFKNNVGVSPRHYLVYVNSHNVIEKKIAITNYNISVNYITKDNGYLLYVYENAESVHDVMLYKYNVQESNEFSGIYNFITTISGTLSEGDTISARTQTNIINNVGCEINVKYLDIVKNEYALKDISFLGDSITAGYTVVNGASSYVDRPYTDTVKELLNCEVYNKGYTGDPISSVGRENCLQTKYNTIISGCNYIVVFAGTNDYYYNVPIGSINDRTDISFCGGVFTLIKNIITDYPDSQLVFMTPIHRETETANSQNATLSDYVNAIIEVCRLCGVPVIDLYSTSYFNYVIDASKALLSDGLHPTQEGYNLLGKVISKYLSDILM